MVPNCLVGAVLDCLVGALETSAPPEVHSLGGMVTSAMACCMASSKILRASVTRSDVSKMDWLTLGFSSRSNGITFRRILLRFTSLWRLVESVT